MLGTGGKRTDITGLQAKIKTGSLILQASQGFNHCGRWDLNPHVVTNTRSLVLPVCQFQHFRFYNRCLPPRNIDDIIYAWKSQPLFLKNISFFHPAKQKPQNANKKRNPNGYQGFLNSCGRRDLNPHVRTYT